MQWMLLPYRKLYRLIEGRSQRKEFWMFLLLNFLIGIALVAILFSVVGSLAAFGGATSAAEPGSMNAGGFGPGGLAPMLAGLGVGAIAFMMVFYIWALATSVAALAVSIRRLHDIGYTGWLLLAYYFVLFVGAMISMWLYWIIVIGFLVVMALPGTRGPNKYGPDPIEGEGVAAFA